MNIPHNLAAYTTFIPQFLLAFISAALLTPIIGAIAQKYKIMDLPGNMRKSDDPTKWRRIHTEPKPKLGGAAVVIPFLIITLLYVPQTKFLWGLVSGIVILVICGIIDDIYDLPAKIQAIFQVIASCLIVLSGLEIVTISNPFGNAINLQIFEIMIHGSIRYLPAAIITIIWIFFIINAVKWVAGSDGLVEGNGAITALIIGLLSVRFQTHDTALMGFTLSGALLGLLIFNFYPSKILSGSTGKSVYGFILAVLAIYSGGKLATFLLTLSLPILDAVWVIVYRIRKHKPKTIFQLFSINDKSHIHHKLLELGLSQRQIAFSEYLFTLCTGILAFILTGMHKALAFFIVVTLLVGLYTFLQYSLKRKRENVDA